MRYEARIKMVDKFVARLKSGEFIYKDEETNERLVSLIYSAIYSLSRINLSDWQMFLAMFKEAKIKALTPGETEQEKIKNYNDAVALVLLAFEKYIIFLRTEDETTPAGVHTTM